MKVEMAITARDFTACGEVAARLEAQGLDCGVIFEAARDPFLQALLAAQRTERLEIATGVAIAFARSPMLVAQTANDLQTLSGGRYAEQAVRYALAIVSLVPLLAAGLLAVAARTVARDVEQAKRA